MKIEGLRSGNDTAGGIVDEISVSVADQKEQKGLANRDDIQTRFDIHDADEGRQSRTA